jgi:uncharacterized protein
MSRLLFFAAIAAVVYVLLKTYRNRLSGGKTPGGGEEPTPAENMVRCVYCGVHLPKSESMLADGQFYCCDAHRRAQQPPPANRDAG